MSQTITAGSPSYVPAATIERRDRWRRIVAVLIALAVLSAAIALFVWYELFRQVPIQYEDEAEHYKYGSIGNEQANGIPYWIWLALPRVFPQYLPGDGGYASLGMVYEPGRVIGDRSIGGAVPVGFSLKTIGVPLVAMNCALCHTAAVRGPGEVVPRLYPGGPSHQLSAQGYIRFLSACAHDDRFTADVLLEEIEYDVKLSPIEKAIYRYVIIPQTRKGLLELEQQYAWMAKKPDWGRGRIDPFNPVKANVLEMAPDDTIGNADMPPLWNMKAHDGFAYHWDGMNSKIRDVVLSSAIGDGATKKTIDLAGLQRVQDYLMKLPVPVWPFSKPDEAKVAKGRPIYEQRCAECHAFGGARTGKVVKVDEVGTDGQRHRLWTDEAARRYNAFADGYPWKFEGFRGTDGPDGGYVSVPMDGIWLRAPYLHNGSVPTLRDLLKPPAQRPKQFWRGSDRYDPQAVGFDTTSEEAKKVGTFFDTAVPGNGNGGHTYGADLTEDEKDALVEYLKTL